MLGKCGGRASGKAVNPHSSLKGGGGGGEENTKGRRSRQGDDGRRLQA